MSSLRGLFNQKLTNLNNELLHMSSLVDEAIELANRSLVERDSAIARQVIKNDQVINELRYDIEEQCYTLLATQQPFAGDLRRITAAIPIATNMERIADHATGIAVLARRLNKASELKPLVNIPRMAEIGRSMLRGSLNAYVSANAKLAHDIATEDHKINQLNEQLLRELLTYMLEDPQNIHAATYLLWVSHNLERIGDRCKNICERVVYVATGKVADFDFHSEDEEELDEVDVPRV